MVRFFSVLLVALLSSQAYTASLEKNKIVSKTGFYQPSLLLEAMMGPSVRHYELGMDFQEDNDLGFAGLYFSSTSYDLYNLDNDASMTAIGIRGLQLSSQTDGLVGIDLHLGINRTEVGDYARTGLEIAPTFYESVSENTSILLGFAFRPEFLSLDWSTDILTEFGFEFGVNYNIEKRVNLFSKYYYEALVDDDAETTRIDDGILFGFTYIF